ncbi:MAG: hypothetical protein H6738_03065 [Alphaproteobacteria bacterium]|nr:hypothetical protein [Alphaproteobacteria bacterium]MCB9695750.1 hypothetical protein [Alphaproteobacteria bacterium]
MRAGFAALIGLVACGDSPPCSSAIGDAVSVQSWMWQDRLVYLVDYGCCDIPTVAFDADSCERLCSPDDGFGGDGGTCTTFSDEASFVETVWEVASTTTTE